MRRQVACACMAVLLNVSAMGAPARFLLEPGTVQVAFRAYGLGLLAIDGQFTRFRGILTLDPADPAACTLTLEAEAASLRMPSASMTADAQGPDLLDVGTHPTFRLDGRCEDGRLAGTLLLHGTSRPVSMEVTTGKANWSAVGTIRRAEWGMGARPMLAGPEVRISITAGLPPGFGG